jgi:hypothetical protein
MRHTFIVMITLLTAGTACGSSHSASKHTTASGLAEQEGSDDVCETTAVTGTNITRVVCRSRGQADEERTAAQAWMSKPIAKGH